MSIPRVVCGAGYGLNVVLGVIFQKHSSLRGDPSLKSTVTLYLHLIFFQEVKVCFDRTCTQGRTDSMLITQQLTVFS